jgi:hypothetical protein
MLELLLFESKSLEVVGQLLVQVAKQAAWEQLLLVAMAKQKEEEEEPKLLEA